MTNVLPLGKLPFSSTILSVKTDSSQRGLIIASIIMATWATSLAVLLNVPLTPPQLLWTLFALLWQTFLYAGLFVTAHDAMHGVITPSHPKINRFVGSLALLTYGLFSYDQLFEAHWQHHHHPASDLDPDFHDGRRKNPFAWYFRFLRRYWSWRRLLALIASFHVMHSFLHVPEANLILFWIVPSLLSSMQLFYFGTYLPHREPAGGYQNAFYARSAYRPFLWSLLACYHFGYHEEHHEYPHVPWWQLPSIATQAAIANHRS